MVDQENSKDSLVFTEEQHRQEIETWSKTCEDLQEDLIIARKRVAEVESQVTLLQQGNLMLTSQVMDLANSEQQNQSSSLVDVVWLQSVKTDMEDVQVRASNSDINCCDDMHPWISGVVPTVRIRKVIPIENSAMLPITSL